MILLIDNYDSFSYNLYQAVGAINPDIRVIRNDALTVEEIAALQPEKIILSPGPGYPKDAGVCMDVDFPDSQLGDLAELYNINESVTLKCALTDIFLDEEDKVVIKSIDFAEMKGCETAQVFTMELVTERSFELILE